MPTLEIEGKKVKVGEDFLKLSPEEQNATVEEIASQMKIEAAPEKGAVQSFLGQANRSIAGAIDTFVANPVEAGINIHRQARGLPAADVIPPTAEMFNNVGIGTATEEPQGFVEGMGAGAGDAAIGAIPIAKGLQMMATKGGAIGKAAETVLNGMRTVPGLTLEVVGGAIYGGTDTVLQDKVENPAIRAALATLASVAAPMGLTGAVQGTKAAGKGLLAGSKKLPAAGPLIEAGEGLVRALMPMTDANARNFARNRLIEVQGADEATAMADAESIIPGDLNATAAQQTQNHGLLAIEDAARRNDPEMDARLSDQAEVTRAEGIAEIAEMGGETQVARNFFADRTADFRRSSDEMVNSIVADADDVLLGKGPQQASTTSSKNVVDGIQRSLDDAKATETELWNAVPRDTTSGTSRFAAAAEELAASVTDPLKDEIPAKLSAVLKNGEYIGEGQQSVGYMLDMYSALRQAARHASAGPNDRPRMARMAHIAADAILEDLGEIADDRVVEAVTEARNYSAELHSIFDQGAVARILQRNTSGIEAIDPEAALQRTAGRGNDQGAADTERLLNAGDIGEDLAEYYRSRFIDAAVGPDGEFNKKSALAWVRENRQSLTKMPHNLMVEFSGAIKDRAKMADYAKMVQERSKGAIADASTTKFNNAKVNEEAASIFSAKDPVAVARSLAATAKKDSSGGATSGLKGAVADYLIDQSRNGTNPRRISEILGDPKTNAAVRQLMTKAEFRRLTHIGRVLDATSPQAKNAGRSKVEHVMPQDANPILERVVQIFGAQAGAQLGKGSAGTSLQAAQMGSSTAKKWLYNLTNQKARALVKKAIEDPAFYRELLLNTSALNDPAKTPRVRALLMATGGFSAEVGDENDG